MLLKYKRLVVKAGTSVLTGGTDRLDLEVMSGLVGQIARLHGLGAEVILVTSGAVAAGGRTLSISHGRKDIPFRQVLAAVGQGHLIHVYEQLFAQHSISVAQALLTWKDLSDRQGYLNVRNTLLALLELGVVPVLNENDVVAVDEIGEVFGDNDRLSALVSNLVDANLLAILTDTAGLYTADPRVDPNAQLIPRVEKVDAAIEALAGGHRNPQARGGMSTKLEAARLATSLRNRYGHLQRLGEGHPPQAGPGRGVWDPVPVHLQQDGEPQAVDAQSASPPVERLSWTTARLWLCGTRTAASCPRGSVVWRVSSSEGTLSTL